MQKVNTLIVLLLFSTAVFAQDSSFKIFLIGDAGDNEMTGETLDSLKSKLMNNSNSAVIFLGDNSYKNALWGLAPFGFKGFDSSQTTQNKIKSQLAIVDHYKGSVFFVPGNHDWWNLTDFAKGKKKLKMEESFIEINLGKNNSIANPENTFQPKDGSPGPSYAELNDKKVRVIFIDTYWLILLGFKKTPAENYFLEKLFYRNLDSLLTDATVRKQKIVVVAHHPIYSKEFHSEPLKHPGFLTRIKISNRNYPSYNKMANQINSILKKYPGIYYASGHLHALQCNFVDGVYYIISGSGSKIHSVSKTRALHDEQPCSEKECLVWNEKGFFELDFSGDKEKIIMYRSAGRTRCDLSSPEK